MKKIVLFCLLAIFTFSANADNKFGGWYVGGNIGLYNTKNSNTIGSISYKSEIKGNKFGGSVSLGWGHEFKNNVYLGLDYAIHFTSKSRDTMQNLTTGKSYSEFSPSTHFVGRLGYIVDNTFMPYAFFGVASAKYERYLESSASSYEKKTGSIGGGTYGIGIESAISTNVFLKLEYQVMKFKDIDSSRFVTYNIKTSYSANTFKVGALYRF